VRTPPACWSFGNRRLTEDGTPEACAPRLVHGA
jgi:hypothetical protein